MVSLIKNIPISLKKESFDTPRVLSPEGSKKEALVKPRGPRIRCPLCGWQPDGKPHWQCEKCFTIFDTFRTRAHCPNQNCGNSWILTQCIACGKETPHLDWYFEGSTRL